MARTISDIKKQMTDGFISNPEVIEKYGLDTTKTFDGQFSKVSLESIKFYIFAFAIWVLETVFDTHRSEVMRIIDTMKPHSAAWYATMARAFQYGFDLLPDSDKFDNAGHTEEEIEASKIVKYAAAIERGGQLQLKIAKTGADGDLIPLTDEERSAFNEYLSRVRDAGVVVTMLTLPADNLKLEIDVYYNPLIINSNGARIDGASETPVRDAIRNYLANIEFDGTFILANLIDAIQKVDGVRFPYPRVVQAHYGDLPFEDLQAQYSPMSGYLRIENENLIINYL